MKKYKWISAVWALSLLFFACEPQEFDDYDLGTKPMETEVTFTTTPQADRPNVVTFNNTSGATGVAVWDFGNGSKGKGDQVTGEYPFAGNYTVTMVLYTKAGAITQTFPLSIESDDLSLLEHPLYAALTGGAENTEGRTWVFDQYHGGHFGVGAADMTSPEWWAAGPNDKLECSLYTQEFTFKQVGVQMNWVNNGFVYTNGAGLAGLAALGYSQSVEPPAGDFDVAYEPLDAYTFSLNTTDSTLTLSDNAFMGHFAGSSTYEILSLNETEMYLKVLSASEPGNAWWYRFIPKELNVKPEVPLKVVPLSEDFEKADVEDMLGFAFDAMGDLSIPGYQNPAPVPLNESPKVFLYQKKAGEFYSNIFYAAEGYKFDLSTQNQITMKVFIPSYNDYTTEYSVAGEHVTNTRLQPAVAVKLQNSDLGGNAWSTQTEIVMADLEKDKWLELTFDFSHVADREDYDKIVIQFGMEGHSGGGVFFFDDFSFSE